MGRWWPECHSVPVPAWWGSLQGLESLEDPEQTSTLTLRYVWTSRDMSKGMLWKECPPAPVAALGLFPLRWETENGDPQMNPALPFLAV